MNVWSKGKTRLGVELSNFSFAPFRHPVHGSFASVEAFWYWYGSGRKHDELRHLYGFSAKTVGTRFETVAVPEDEFHEAIREAIRCKISQNPELRKIFVESELPFVHYFVYGKDMVIYKEKHRWQMEHLEALRKEFQAADAEELKRWNSPF